MEKLNDDCRRTHLQKSNKWNACKDVLLAEQRLEYLNDVRRTPRKYNKKSDQYWSKEIRESRNKRPRLSNENVQNEDPLLTLTPEELQSRLKDIGIKTRVRNRTTLLDMYRVNLQSQL